MASDVEVLRGLLDPAGGQGLPEVVRRAIAAGLAALEAREAQPKVEGRMSDVDALRATADLAQRESVCDYTGIRSGGDQLRATRREFERARASEAALSDGVAALEEALGEIRTACEDKGMRPGYSDKETLARRRLQAIDYVYKTACAALSAQSKPGTP